MSEPTGSGHTPDAERGRQRVERVAGSRRARLTPAPGTVAEPLAAEDAAVAASEATTDVGPNDDRMRNEVPPHY